MKLRNKKTGEIIESNYNMLAQIISTKGVHNLVFEDLTQFNNEWEDYKPTEPLIKDEKIRKAVRAWAESLDLRWFRRCSSRNAHTSRLYGQDASGTGYTMEFAPNDLYGDSISKNGYTITELCGEEE